MISSRRRKIRKTNHRKKANNANQSRWSLEEKVHTWKHETLTTARKQAMRIRMEDEPRPHSHGCPRSPKKKNTTTTDWTDLQTTTSRFCPSTAFPTFSYIDTCTPLWSALLSKNHTSPRENRCTCTMSTSTSCTRCSDLLVRFHLREPPRRPTPYFHPALRVFALLESELSARNPPHYLCYDNIIYARKKPYTSRN